METFQSLLSSPESISGRTAHRDREKDQTLVGEFETHHSPEDETAFREIREILIHNGDTFASKAAFLDSLLVFVSGVLDPRDTFPADEW